MKSKIKKRNKILTYLMSYDPKRVQQRIVPPKKGKGRKEKPRRKDWSREADSHLGVDNLINMLYIASQEEYTYEKSPINN